MPNYFCLIAKDTGKPEKLQEVDNKMREHFGAPPSDTEWFKAWYDIEGLGLAMGYDWQRLRSILDEDRHKLIDWLEKNYTADAWSGR